MDAKRYPAPDRGPRREPPHNGTGPPRHDAPEARANGPPGRGPRETRRPPPDPWEAWRRRGRRLLRHVVRANPAYLLSAVLMIAGVYTIVEPGKQQLGNLPAILATFSTLQVYELLLVGIAVFLVCSRRVYDDGATVVLLEALFVVGSFMLLDEVTFRHSRLGLGLGLAACGLAVVRFGVLGRAVGRSVFRSPLGWFVLVLFAWNGVAPAVLAGANVAGLDTLHAVHLGNWWVLTALAAGLALYAHVRAAPLWPRGHVFVRSPVTRWMMAGFVLVASAVHQYGIGYLLDHGLALCDLLPLATVVCVGLVGLLAKAGPRARVAERLVAALPPALCLLAILDGRFEPMLARQGLPGKRAHFVHELRMLTWPVAWLALCAALTLLHAWRRRSLGFARQGAVLLLLAAAFVSVREPGQVEVNLAASGGVLAAILLASAVAFRSPLHAAGFLAIANVALRRALAALPDYGTHVTPDQASLSAVGLSCFALWLLFRPRVPRWVAHIGTALAFAAVLWAGFAPATRVPPWLVAGWAVSLGVATGLVARWLGWWPYYGLAAVAAALAPARLVTTYETAKGWLFILGAFLLLALGVLISTRKEAQNSRQPTG